MYDNQTFRVSVSCRVRSSRFPIVRGRKVIFTTEGAGGAEGVPAFRLGGANRVAAQGSIPDTAFTMKNMKVKNRDPGSPRVPSGWPALKIVLW